MLLFSLGHCCLWFSYMQLNLTLTDTWLIRPCVMIWSLFFPLTSSCVLVPMGHPALTMLVFRQFLELLATLGPYCSSFSDWDVLPFFLCLANSCHLSGLSLKCHLLGEAFSDSLICICSIFFSQNSDFFPSQH
jgi:hypothetical protein